MEHKAEKELSNLYYINIKSPNAKSPSARSWARSILDEVLTLQRRRIVLFDHFPPEYLDYYKVLQEYIAKLIPEEHDRPFICLNIQGRNRLKDKDIADIGVAGGTGPLSDATTLENLMYLKSGINNADLLERREYIAEHMKNFSCVVYSMPPFRGIMDFIHDSNVPIPYTTSPFLNFYFSLYNRSREDFPCKTLYILTNTGHINKWIFDSAFVLGTKELGAVDDMTVKIADHIQQEAKPGDTTLVLGTIVADKANLYPNLLSKGPSTPALPTGTFAEMDAKEYLQLIIDQIKKGKAKENMPGEKRTCGQAFIDFIIHFATLTKCSSLLFSCTELDIILQTTLSSLSKQTYFDKLKIELKKLPNNTQYRFYNSDELFIEIIAEGSSALEKRYLAQQRYNQLKRMPAHREDPIRQQYNQLKVECLDLKSQLAANDYNEDSKFDEMFHDCIWDNDDSGASFHRDYYEAIEKLHNLASELKDKLAHYNSSPKMC